MTNVRIDQNGLPKGPVYDQTIPASRRSAVTVVEATNPAESAGIVTLGYQKCWFDLGIPGTGFTSLEVQAIFWNSRLSQWFGGGTRTFTSTGRHALTVVSRGQKIFLKVISYSGTSFSLNADYALS